MPSIHILADDRESQSTVIEALRDHDGVEVTLSRLESGDYLLNNRLLFERKTMRDFAASLQDGRLFDQGIRLAASPLHKAIILEGNARDLASCGIGREALQGALITLTLFLGIPLLRAIDPQETAKLMLYAVLQFDRIAGQAAPKLFAGKRPRGKRKTQQRILQSLPGIGPSTADKLLEHFGSVEAVLAADGPALQGVAGIGFVRAKAIRWAVEESWVAYRSNR